MQGSTWEPPCPGRAPQAWPPSGGAARSAPPAPRPSRGHARPTRLPRVGWPRGGLIRVPRPGGDREQHGARWDERSWDCRVGTASSSRSGHGEGAEGALWPMSGDKAGHRPAGDRQVGHQLASERRERARGRPGVSSRQGDHRMPGG